MDRKPLDFYPEGKNLKIRGARLYSDLFSPPSVYAIFAFAVAWYRQPFQKGFLHAAVFGLLTSLVPTIYILVRLRQGKVSDLHLSQPGERTLPYLLGALGAFLAYLALQPAGSTLLFNRFILTVILGLLVLALINTRWMISAHTASITAVTVFAGFYFNLSAGLAITPLVLSTCYIRYYLKRHTMGELLSGIVVGIAVVSGPALLGTFQG
jgi:membrane-associated phospholipid phosphatase